LGAAARFNSIIAAWKCAASRAARSIHRSSGRGGGSTTASNARRSDRTAKRRADSYRSASRSRTVAANDGALANVERNIEQLKANQQQIASDNSKAIKAIEELKASQEEIKRVLARVSEQNLPKTSPPPTQPTPTLRKPERTLRSPYARARPRIPREWMYDEW
jgi:hypothetical protein